VTVRVAYPSASGTTAEENTTSAVTAVFDPTFNRADVVFAVFTATVNPVDVAAPTVACTTAGDVPPPDAGGIASCHARDPEDPADRSNEAVPVEPADACTPFDAK